MHASAPVTSADSRGGALEWRRLATATLLVSLVLSGTLPAAYAGETTRASLASAAVEGNDFSIDPSISANGRFVAFSSDASNLVPDDGNGVDDVFVHDRK